jgi:hypothetical protein
VAGAIYNEQATDLVADEQLERLAEQAAGTWPSNSPLPVVLGKVLVAFREHVGDQLHDAAATRAALAALAKDVTEMGTDGLAELTTTAFKGVTRVAKELG